MPVSIHFQGGPRAGQVVEFNDDVARITVGRDPDKCQVVFGPQETKVGREHFALRRELGRYRLVLNKDDVVLVDGRAGIDDQELTEMAELQLGHAGPKLLIQTVMSGKLAATERQGHQVGKATMLRHADRAASRGWKFAAAALVLVVVASTVGWRMWHKTDAKLAEWQILTKGQQAALVDISAKFNTVDQQTKDLAEKSQQEKDRDTRFEEALVKVADSVYLVLDRDPDGNLTTVATAWVVDQARGILATNAHVASEFNSIPSDHQLLVRSTAETPLDFVVQSVQIHPGYSAFGSLWTDFDPTRRTSRTSATAIASPGNGCDVALMTVADPTGLAPGLPLASEETLKSLRPGYPVGTVGYPMEGLVLEGVQVQSPTPTTHVAYLTAITNYFGASKVDSAERQLVQHALPAAGGSSGSPIVNQDGQVVAVLNGGNFIGTVESGARIGSSANVGFGQRADLVQELLANTADTNQPARTQRWQEEIQQYYVRRSEVEQQIGQAVEVDRERSLTDAVDRWKSNLALYANLQDVQLVGTYEGTASGIGTEGPAFQGSQLFDISQPGSILVVTITKTAPTVKLDVYETVGGSRSRVYHDNTDAEWLRTCTFDIASATSFEAIVSCDTQDAAYSLQVYQATTQAMSPLDRREAAVSSWLNSLLLNNFKVYTSELLSETWPNIHAQGESGTIHADVIRLDIAEPGDYLAVAVAPGGEDIDLYVSHAAATTYGEIGSDRNTDAWPSVPFTLTEAGPIDLYVAGTTDYISVNLRVYRAVP